MKRDRAIISRQRYTPEQKSQLLDQFERCRLSVAEFAAQHGIVASTLFGWLRRRRRGTGGRRNKPAVASNGFQQVSLASVLSTGGPWVGEVQLPDGTQVRWGSQVECSLLHEVLAHLRGPC